MTRARSWLIGRAALVTSCAVLAACGTKTETQHASAEEHGRVLFSAPTASPSQSNAFACSTCHSVAPTGADTSRAWPGAALGGVTARASFWGGRERDLLRSINDCRTAFMDAPSPWTTEDEDARALYAYLAMLQGDATPFSFTLREGPVADVRPLDAARGESAYARACQTCHGTLHDGGGRLASFIPALPDEVLMQHAGLGLSAESTRGIFLRKIRRGGADAQGQSMPPFSTEALPDEDVAGLMAHFGL